MTGKPTPLTDSWVGYGIGGLEVVPASFARTLERQQSALIEALETLGNMTTCSCELSNAEQDAWEKAYDLIAALKGGHLI